MEDRRLPEADWGIVEGMTASSPHDGRGGLREPLPAGLERTLRRIVQDHATAERRRRHTPLLHVGRPTAEVIHAIRPEERTDHALRADIVAAMVRQIRSRHPGPPPLAWLTRGGPLDLQDVDMTWSASAAQAYGEAGLPLVFVVVDRHGWLDVRSGVRRTWVRLRPPGSAPPTASAPPLG